MPRSPTGTDWLVGSVERGPRGACSRLGRFLEGFRELSRFFRLYEKKRGNRRTGSPTVGNLGEAVFFGIFFVVGCGALAYMLAALVWPEWRANRQFEETTCTIIDQRVGSPPRDVWAERELEPATFRPEFKVRYDADDGIYEADNVYDATNLYSADEASARRILEQFEVGHQYPCWYDPLNPGRVVLVRGYSAWLYVSLLIPLSFIVIGGGRMIYALVHWNASEERRSVMDQRAGQLDLFEGGASERDFPTVPTDANLTNSPGTTLAYRLPMSTTPGWKLFATVAAAVAWNALVALFLVMAVGSFTRGAPDWLLAASTVLFLAGGLWLAAYASRQVIMTTSVGPTRVEISNHPLVPGKPYEIFLSQAGRFTMRALEVWLACEERVTYLQGTDTRTERRRVYERRCFVRENIEIAQGLPFESRCQVEVPRGAMHSFLAAHNDVSWKLIVKGSVAGRAEFQREFQIVVNPGTNGQEPS